MTNPSDEALNALKAIKPGKDLWPRVCETLYRRNVDGVLLRAQIEENVFIYRHHRLGIRVSMVSDDGTVLNACSVTDGSKTSHDYNSRDIESLLGKVKIIACKECGEPAFDPSAVETNRNGLCEKCFMDDLNKEFKKESEKERKKVAYRDAKKKAEGFTHRITAWIHAGGDDRQVDFYTNAEPTKKQIQALIRKEGSRVLDDYTVQVL